MIFIAIGNSPFPSDCIVFDVKCSTNYYGFFPKDKYDDIHAGVKSTALKFGDQSKTWLLTFATGVTGGLTTAGYLCHQPWLYYVGVGTVMTSLVHQVIIVKSSCGHFRL